jgi:hypothetical protein
MSKPVLKKILFIFGATLYVLSLLVVVTIVLIPTSTQFGFKHWLEQQHLQGGIGDIDLSLKTGTLTVHDAIIRKNQQTLLHLGKFQLRIRLSDLTDHKLTIERVDLANTKIQIAQQADALVIAGINLNQASGTAPPAPVSTTQENNQPWTIELQQLHIGDLDTCFSTSKTSQPLKVCNHLGDLAWHGTIRMTTRDPLGFKSAGNFSISNFNLQDENRKLSLVRFDSLALTNINIDSLEQIKFDTLELQQFTMLPNQDTKAKNTETLGFGKLLVNTVSLNHTSELDIAAIHVENISTYIKLKADNRVASLDELAGYRSIADNKNQPESKTAVTPATQKPFRFKIGKIAVTTKKSLVLVDAHTKPATVHKIENFSITLGAIDSSQPEQASDLTMNFKYGHYGTAKVSGTVMPFAAKPTVNLHASILGLNLNRVSTYTRELLQHKIKSGQLDAQIEIKIVQGKLDSDAKLTLNKFYVNKLSGKEMDRYQKDLGIPLSSALYLLRDKNDTIKIELPVTGEVEHPDFSLNDIIATVSAKAIKAAIVKYYSALGLISLVTGAFDLMTALRFEPLAFLPGQSTLTETSRTALDKFATMLNERPQVHLVLCGHATLADQSKLFPSKKSAGETAAASTDSKTPPITTQQRQQLNKLAQLRGDQVKQYLVEQKGVAADRLILCNPEYDASDKRSPYVELHI